MCPPGLCDPKDRLVVFLNRFCRWRDMHRRIVGWMIAMAALDLPAYTMLEIVLAMDDMTVYPYVRVANVVLKVDKSIQRVKNKGN